MPHSRGNVMVSFSLAGVSINLFGELMKYGIRSYVTIYSIAEIAKNVKLHRFDNR